MNISKRHAIRQVVTILLFKIIISEALNCEGHSKEKCSIDCMWNTKEHKCQDCPFGFYANGCSLPCRYPNYGENCQQDCSSCSKQLCNSTYGCPETGLEGGNDSFHHSLAIGVPLGFGILLVMAVFIGVTVGNRRFLAEHIRQNKPNNGSYEPEDVVEEITHRPEEPFLRSDDINMVANTFSDQYVSIQERVSDHDVVTITHTPEEPYPQSNSGHNIYMVAKTLHDPCVSIQ